MFKVLEKITRSEKSACETFFHQFLEFDLETIFSAALISDNSDLNELALKFYGTLLSQDDKIALEFLNKVPSVHSMIHQNLIVSLDITPYASSA